MTWVNANNFITSLQQDNMDYVWNDSTQNRTKQNGFGPVT